VQRLQQLVCGVRCTLLEVEHTRIAALLAALARLGDAGTVAAVAGGEGTVGGKRGGGGAADEHLLVTGRSDSLDSMSSAAFPLAASPQLRAARGSVASVSAAGGLLATPTKRAVGSSASVAGPVEPLNLGGSVAGVAAAAGGRADAGWGLVRPGASPQEVRSATADALARTQDDWMAPAGPITATIAMEMGVVEAARQAAQDSPLHKHAQRVLSSEVAWPALAAGHPTSAVLAVGPAGVAELTRDGLTPAATRRSRGAMYRSLLREHKDDGLAYAAAEATVMSVLGYKAVARRGGGGGGAGEDGAPSSHDPPLSPVVSPHAGSLLVAHRHPTARTLHEVLLHAVDDRLPWDDAWARGNGVDGDGPAACTPRLAHISALLGVSEVGDAVLIGDGSMEQPVVDAGQTGAHAADRASSASHSDATARSAGGRPSLIALGGGSGAVEPLATGAVAVLHSPLAAAVREGHYSHTPDGDSTPPTGSPTGAPVGQEARERRSSGSRGGEGALPPRSASGSSLSGGSEAPRQVSAGDTVPDIDPRASSRSDSVDSVPIAPMSSSPPPHDAAEEDALLVLLSLYLVGCPLSPPLVRDMVQELLQRQPADARADCERRLWSDLRRLRTCLGETGVTWACLQPSFTPARIALLPSSTPRHLCVMCR